MARILVVEDSISAAENLIWALELRGHDVKWAKTVRDGDDLINEFHFELGIIDQNLPDGHGTDLLPLPFKGCIYSAMPEDAETILRERQLDVPCFSKNDPSGLLDWLSDMESTHPWNNKGEKNGTDHK